MRYLKIEKEKLVSCKKQEQEVQRIRRRKGNQKLNSIAKQQRVKRRDYQQNIKQNKEVKNPKKLIKQQIINKVKKRKKMFRGLTKFNKVFALNSFKNSLVAVPKANLNHVQNMLEENLKYDAQKYNDEVAVIQKTSRIYKPTYTIEFNREGEVLVYSADPIKNSVVYFKYPYVLYEAAIPLFIWAWIYNVRCLKHCKAAFFD